MGATTTYPLLSTVMSRVKKIKISEFSDELIIKALEKMNNNCSFSKDELNTRLLEVFNRGTTLVHNN